MDYTRTYEVPKMIRTMAFIPNKGSKGPLFLHTSEVQVHAQLSVPIGLCRCRQEEMHPSFKSRAKADSSHSANNPEDHSGVGCL